jgi:hypothetical protein
MCIFVLTVAGFVMWLEFDSLRLSVFQFVLGLVIGGVLYIQS